MTVKMVSRAARTLETAEWKSLHVCAEFEDGKLLASVQHPVDLVRLGNIQGHCSARHAYWVYEKGYTTFICLLGEKHGDELYPITTMHAKQVKYFRGNRSPDEPSHAPNGYTCAGIPKQDMYYGWVGLDSYDGGFNEDGTYRGNMYDDPAQMVEQYEREYERYKKMALQYGPLNRDNPYKHDMDYFNREKASWKHRLEAAKQYAGIRKGDSFIWNRRKWNILTYTSRGLDEQAELTYLPYYAARFLKKR